MAPRAVAAAAAPLLVVLAALAAALPAAGAGASLGLDAPPFPAVPPGEERSVVAEVVYRHDAASDNATEVTLAVEDAPAWLAARIEPATLQLPANGTSGTATASVTLTVAARAGAPALEQHTLRVRLRAAANGPLEAAQATAGVPVRVDYVGALEVLPPEAPVPAVPGEPANVPLRFRNLGNGPARVTLDAPHPPESVAVQPPGPFVLEAEGALQERVLNVSVLPQQPGTFPLVVRYVSAHPVDPTHLGASGEVAVTLEVQREGVPGPSPAVALGALMAAAALAGTRRRGA